MAKTKSRMKVISQEKKAKKARFLAECKKRREFRGKMQDAKTNSLVAAYEERKQNFTESLGLLKHAMKLDEQPSYLSSIIRVYYKMGQYDKVCKVINLSFNI